MQKALEYALVEALRRAHGAHTIILYGSRARGDATVDSDVDALAFAEVPTALHDARPWEGLFLDAFVQPTGDASGAPDEALLRVLGGQVLLDERDLAGPFLRRLAALEARGPVPLTPDEALARRTWAHKMLARAARDDVEASYRRHWLLYQLLEDDFALRDEWFRGPKLALKALAERRPETHEAFARALAPGATLSDVARLVHLVVGPEPSPSSGP